MKRVTRQHPTQAPTIVDRIGRWGATLRLGDIPARVVDKIRLQVATSLTAAAAAPWHETARAVARVRCSPGPSLVWATGRRVAPADAAFVNAAFAMALDFDDYLLCGHPGHSAVLVPLAYAETLADVLVAAAVANEVAGRLSTSALLGPLNGQMSSYIHNAGAAVALGKLMGLGPEAMANALGLALYQPSFCLAPGFWDAGAKTLTASIPLDQGLDAARLAAAGVSGPRDLFEHPLGFPTFFAFARFPGLFDGLGSVWFSDTLCFKRYPGTSYVSAAVEGALRASGGRPLGPGEIDAIEIDTTILSAMVDHLSAQAQARSPLDGHAINFSVRLSVAAALCFGDLTPDHLRPEVLATAERPIRAIARKVRLRHDWAQTLRLFAASPVSVRMFTQLGPSELGRVVLHWRRLARASGADGAVEHRWSKEIVRLLPALRGVRRGPVSDLAFDPTLFRMHQSARTTLVARGKRTTEMVDIPAGACGRDPDETRAVVRGRCAMVFGERAPALLRALEDPACRVRDLERIIAGPGEAGSGEAGPGEVASLGAR